MQKTPFTLAILVKNEEKNIEKCIEPFAALTDDILVLDDSSIDASVPLAQSKGARIEISPKTISFAAKRNECLRLSKYDWVFFIDADERPDSRLLYWLQNFYPKSNVAAYRFARVDNFWGRELKRGEVATAYERGISRLINRKYTKYFGSVHEDVQISSNYSAEKALGVIMHYPHENLSEFIREVNIYSSIRADELLYKKSILRIVFEMIFYPPAKFWYTYVARGGIFEGSAGFCYSFIMAFHSFLVRAKLLAKTT